ncbi:MAG: serine/threonine protein kinase [Actinomycetes bacterium]
MSPQPGTVLGSRYLLNAPVASGGMGEVWQATDEVLGRTVAVKVLKSELVDDPTFLQRFRAEARSAASLGHPGIAQVYDYGELDRSAYLVMELVPGEPLSSLLAREGAQQVDRALDLVGQSAMALHAAHVGGVVHRDVKPGNLLVTPEGEVKVTDFGIARAADAVPLTRTGSVMGTAHYLSPEQASGDQASPLSDVYSLGVVAYECLTGERPFPGDNAIAVAMAQVREPVPPLPGTIPPGVSDLVLQTLAKNPAERPASAADLARRTAELRGLSPQVGATMPPFVPAPTVLGAGAAVTAATAVGGADGTRVGEPTGEGGTAPIPTVGGEEADESGKGGWWRNRTARARAGMVALALGALLLGGAVLTGALNDEPAGQGPKAGPSPSATSTASSTPSATTAAGGAEEGSGDAEAAEPATVTISEGDYVGRPYDPVRAELTGLGLAVQRRSAESGSTAGNVIDVSPVGTLQEGATVAVTVAEPPAGSSDQPDEPDPTTQPSPTQDPDQTEEPTPTPEPTTTPTPSETPLSGTGTEGQ